MTDPLAPLDPPARAAVRAAARPLRLAAGATAFRPGQPCAHWLIVCAGRVRVSRLAGDGRAIVLYRVGAGESCVLTTAGLLEGGAYEAEATAETAVEALLLPAAEFLRLIAEHASFRRLAFAAYASRLAALMELAAELAFDGLGTRLARRLLALRAADGGVPATHEALAAELGTAREVVSRRLKAFERRGYVALARGRILVSDPAALAAAARLSVTAVTDGRAPIGFGADDTATREHGR